MAANRDSASSHRSESSLTAYNHSNQTTPKIGGLPKTARRASNSSRSSRSSSENDDESDDESEDEYGVKRYPEDPVEGWPGVASLMAKTPDFAAFSRFRDLNIKSLLYYQAQLTNLKRNLHKQEYKDNRSQVSPNKDFASRADFLMTTKGAKQLKLITEIRLLLKEYSKYLELDPCKVSDGCTRRSITAIFENISVA
jgi:hypothetical protein